MVAGEVAVSTAGLTKHFQVPVRDGGMLAAIRGMFHRQYRTVEAVTDVTFEIARGEIVGFLGPNGAGKTTTLKMLSGLLMPSVGEASVLGFEPFDRDRDFLERIAMVMGNRQTLQWDLPAVDSFELHRSIYRIPRATFARTRDELIELLDVGDLVAKPVRQLSLGERMKVELVDSLLHQPEVVFLDEPTLGLDATMQRRLRAFLADYNATTGATILLTSHYMADVEALCKRVMVIHHGRLRFDGSLAALVKRFSAQKTIRVDLATADDSTAEVETERALTALRTAGVAIVESSFADGTVTVQVVRDAAPRTVSVLLAELDALDVSVEEPSLETVIDSVFRSDGDDVGD